MRIWPARTITVSIFLLCVFWYANAAAFFCFGFGGGSSARSNSYSGPYFPGPAFRYPPFAMQPTVRFPSAPRAFDSGPSAAAKGATAATVLEKEYSTPGVAEAHVWRFRPLK